MRGRSGPFVVTLLVMVCGGPLSLFGQDVPAYLPETIRSDFDAYTQQAPNRAFALGRGGWGSAHGQPSLQNARATALSNCREFAEQCVVIAKNDEIVRPEDPFPDASDRSSAPESATKWSGRTALLLAKVGLAVLVGGTVVAERYPLYLFSTGLSDTLRIRLNYAVVLVGFVYFLCMMPVSSRVAQWDFSTLLAWIVFSAPILPVVLSVLYLQWCGQLTDRFEVN